MTIQHPLTRAAIGTALLLAIAACGSDTIVTPTFGSACNVGSLATGQVKHSRFTPGSCLQTYNFWSEGRIPYESWTVQLTAGKGYMFYEAQEPDAANDSLNDVDALLTLWGTNASGVSVPLAISDDDGDGIDGHDSQIWFIAPVSGTFQLVAASYWGDEFGGYRIEAHECPVIATLDTAGTYDLTLPDSPCVRVSPNGNSTDTSKVAMIAIPAGPGDQVTTTISSSAFTPTWEMFGPGFDTYANIYDATQSDGNYGSGNSTSLSLAELGGTSTLAIGSTTVDSTGAFSVAYDHVVASAPPPAARPWSIAALAGIVKKQPALKRR